jgi:hypothetical protein
MPREGGTRGQPHRLHHRQPEREKRRKGGACIDPHGFDAGKLIKGKKRHIRSPKEYGLHFNGVTSSEFPFLELIQPAAVRLHGHLIVYGLPRPSVTCSVTSSSNGALSIGFQPSSGGPRIGHFHSSYGDNIARPGARVYITANSPHRGCQILNRVLGASGDFYIACLRHPRVPKGTIKYCPTVPNSALDRDRDTVEACRLVLGMRCRPGYKTCTWSRNSTRDLQADSPSAGVARNPWNLPITVGNWPHLSSRPAHQPSG